MRARLNGNFQERDRIIWGSSPGLRFTGGIESFTDLTVEKLRLLVSSRFADPDDRQNSAPSIGAFLAFMERWPFVRAHGYAVSPERDDYRVSVEGLEGTTPDDISEDDLTRFIDEWRQLLSDDRGMLYVDEHREPKGPGQKFFCWFD